MEDTLSFIIVFACGAYIGYRVNEMLMAHIFRKMLDDAGISTNDLNKFTDHWRTKLGKDEEGLTDVEIRIEKVNDQLFAFHVGSDEFIAQGQTKEDLLAAIEKRMTNVKLVISQEHGAEFVK
jgi:archaellum component FlaC